MVEYGRFFETPTEMVDFNVGYFVSGASSKVLSLSQRSKNYNDTDTIVILKFCFWVNLV